MVPPMSPSPSKPPTERVVRGLTAIQAVGLIGYAVSDHPMYGGGPGFGTSQAVILGLGCALLLCTLLPPQTNARVLLVSLSGLFALAILEFAANALLSPLFRPCYQEDERLLFELRPDCTSIFQRSAINGGDRILQHVNSDGFRGPEPQRPSPGFRVVVYGDSFIHATYSPDEETFAFKLEEELTKRLAAPADVINAGVSSYGPDQISLRLPGELETLRPDLVVMAIFAGNDYGDLLRNKLFKVDEKNRLIENDGRMAPHLLEGFARSQSESILKRGLRSALSRSGEARTPYSHLELTAPDTDPDVALMNYWLEMAESEYREYVVDGDDTINNIFMDHYSADLSLRPSSASALYKVRLMNAVLQRAKDSVDRAGTQLALLLIPHPINVVQKYDVGRVEEQRFPEHARRNLISPLEDWARTNEVPFLSLFDPFKERDANALYFHGGDDHWNAAGQALAAELMTEYLAANNLLGQATR